MPTNDEIIAKLDKIDKAVSKILSINTKIAKTLHLIPVTEKEERDIQILQRKNLEIAAKVNDELNSMENKTEDPSESLFDSIQGNVFNDVLGDDFLNRS